MKKVGSIIFGACILVLGITLLLKTMGIVTFSVWDGFRTYWPLGLIIIGIALLLRANWAVFTIALIMIVFAGLILSEKLDSKEKNYFQKVEADKAIKKLELEIDFGAGDIFLQPGKNDFIITNNARSIKEPELTKTIQGETVKVSIKKDEKTYLDVNSNWDINISTDVECNIVMRYGATNMNADLRKLKVKNIEISSGAATTDIAFGKYPTYAKIKAGVSDINFDFPKNYGVKLVVNGGAINSEINGFTKDGKIYYKDFNEDNDYILVEVDAGAARITADELY